MSARAIILTGVFFLIVYFVTAQDYQHFFNEAKKALAEKRYQNFIRRLKRRTNFILTIKRFYGIQAWPGTQR